MVRFLVIGLSAALCAVGVAQQLNVFVGGHPQPATQTAAVVLPAPSDTSGEGEDGGKEAAIAKASDGHFWADAEVDGHPVHLVVDTGATDVTLTADDARRLGVVPESLTYNYNVMTANGPAHAASIQLGEISVGNAQVFNVQALVIDQGLPTSLLGMSFLGRLSKFEATPDTLVLRS